MFLKTMNFKIIFMKIESDGMTRRFRRYLLDLMTLVSAILRRRKGGRQRTVRVSLHIGNHQSPKKIERNWNLNF
jgi:hypothetical protein